MVLTLRINGGCSSQGSRLDESHSSDRASGRGTIQVSLRLVRRPVSAVQRGPTNEFRLPCDLCAAKMYSVLH